MRILSGGFALGAGTMLVAGFITDIGFTTEHFFGTVGLGVVSSALAGCTKVITEEIKDSVKIYHTKFKY